MSESIDPGATKFDPRQLVRLSLQRQVDQLTRQSEFALACFWFGTGVCSPNGEARAGGGLDLLVWAGETGAVKKGTSRDRTDCSPGPVPLNAQQIESIAISGEPLVIPRLKGDGNGLLREDWAAEEQIRGFFGAPVTVAGVIRGVFAVCSRTPLNEAMATLLSTLATTAGDVIEQAEQCGLTQLENSLLSLQMQLTKSAVSVSAATPATRKLEAQISLAARYEGPVLITGGSGSVSQDVARQIHQARPQRSGTFIPVDAKRFCEAMRTVDATLLQRFQGTLLLENIDLIPFEKQKSLAQLLTSAGASVGSGASAPKFLAAITKKNPETSADELQHDLRCLLSVLTVEIPPLNERPDDLQELANRFLNELQLRHGRTGLILDSDELERMQQYPWPGNDRELELALERAVIRLPSQETVVRHVIGPSPFATTSEPQGGFASEDQVKEWQRENLIACLEQCHWKVYGSDGAAALAGIKPTTFISRMKKFGIVRRQNKNQ